MQAAEEDQAAEASRAAAAALAAEITQLQAGAAIARDQRPGLSRERDQARAAGERLPEVQAEADRHHRAALDTAALVDARTEAGRQSEAYVAAKLDYIHLFEEASRLRRERIDNMRAELAATLVDGAPCPVCGSLDHPELCELRGDRVTREQEEAADAAAAEAAERAETIGARLGIADAQVSDLSARLESAGFTVAADLISLQAEATRLRAAARDLAAQAGQLAELRRTDHQAALDDLDRGLADADKRLAELASQREADLTQAAQAAQAGRPAPGVAAGPAGRRARPGLGPGRGAGRRRRADRRRRCRRGRHPGRRRRHPGRRPGRHGRPGRGLPRPGRGP